MNQQIFEEDTGTVQRVSVQVSKYSEENGGSNLGTLFLVEVLFPDGKWEVISRHKDLAEAQKAARVEAEVRDAVVLAQSFWPNRKVNGL